MHRLPSIPLLISLLSLPLCGLSHAQPAAAELVEKEYQASMEKWALELRLAETPEARAAAVAKRPDPHAAAKRMWAAIGGSLKEGWTLEPASWFLSLASNLIIRKEDGLPGPAYAQETKAIREAVEQHHLKSPDLTPMCFALTAGNDPGTLALLEKIIATNPDKKIQGVASLATAMVLKNSGDTPELMARRLTAIKKAIIDSADVEIGGTSVSRIAADELYIIRYLTKGRVAPDLQGTDSAGRALTLSEQKGKIVVLMFWNSNISEANRVVEFANGLQEKFQGQPVVVLGVNNDPLEQLRGFQADGTVRFRNFSDPENKLSAEYRIGHWPLIYVLDAERKVSFTGAPGSFVELAVEALLNPAPATPAK
ncbi:redoxin domain-containing protein [Luteolibacter sp. SL250]|uniref:peroxiredoxin family protein n=1 Tax=Luteolibacter sp. SL250 TaxID=2995170 RepID=UPI00226E72D3|nr:redoxin domain-containing protein [Luteolibacter sp. SL250]WAC21551.1 redoxin domain-containing protein [Luteolibacter sp. SL250]